MSRASSASHSHLLSPDHHCLSLWSVVMLMLGPQGKGVERRWSLKGGVWILGGALASELAPFWNKWALTLIRLI
jgi:hypothetical protein